MILVDTSVWVDHLREGEPALAALLEGGEVLIHPFVLGELACGNLRNRRELLTEMTELPAAAHATDAEALEMLERHRLMGRGIGYLDLHLLTSVYLTGTTFLWTRDRRLAEVASELGVAAPHS